MRTEPRAATRTEARTSALSPQSFSPTRSSVLSTGRRGPTADSFRALVPAALEIHEEDGDRGGRHAGDAGGLSDACRTDSPELLPHLVGAAGDRGVIHIPRDPPRLKALEPFHLLKLPLDVPLVLELHLNLIRHLRVLGFHAFIHQEQIRKTNLRPSQNLHHRGHLLKRGGSETGEHPIQARGRLDPSPRDPSRAPLDLPPLLPQGVTDRIPRRRLYP